MTEVIHRLFIVNHIYPIMPIIENVECHIVSTEKITWAEPIMPVRGRLRKQKRFMLGAYAFYTRSQAEKKKILLLIQAAKAGPKQRALSSEAYTQLQHFKETGVVK